MSATSAAPPRSHPVPASERVAGSRAADVVDDLEVDTTGDVAGVVVAVRGEVDARTAPMLAVALAAKAGDPHVRLVIDLAGCTFLGAAGLHAVAETAAVVARSGGSLVVRGAPAPIQRILDLTGIGQLVHIEPVPAEA